MDETDALSLPVLLLAILAFMALVMALAWLVQKRAHNTGWVDVVWSFGTAVAGAAAALIHVQGDETVMPLRRWLVASLVIVWALRLGTFVALRVKGSAEDARYRTLRKQWGGKYDTRLFGFLQVQGPVTVILCLAIAFAARAPRFEIGIQDVVGVLIWLAAVGGETLADNQMKRFKADPLNRGKICDTGLWAWSRHPNYFFEWLGWFAYPAMAISPDDPASFLSLGAPVVMYLVLRHGTGVPPLEASMAASRGKAFEDYKARTSTFLLLPPRREVIAKTSASKKSAAAKPTPKTGRPR